MRFTKLLLIAITLVSIFSSVRTYAAFSCEDLINPQVEYSPHAFAELATAIQIKQRFISTLRSFIGVPTSLDGWQFRYLNGATTLGGNRNLQLMISNKLPEDRQSLLKFVEELKSPMPYGSTKQDYNLERISLIIQGTDYAHGAIFGNQVKEYAFFNFYVNSDTILESYAVTGDVFDAIVVTHVKDRSQVRSRLTIEKTKDGEFIFTIYNEKQGIRNFWNPAQTFITNNLNWQNDPTKTSQSFSWFERVFLDRQNQTYPKP